MTNIGCFLNNPTIPLLLSPFLFRHLHMYWTRSLFIIQITTFWTFSVGHLSAECFLNYLLANYAFLNFDLLSVRSLNFPKISAPFLIGPFFIIGDCVYEKKILHYFNQLKYFWLCCKYLYLRVFSL